MQMPSTPRATESPGSRALEGIREMPWRRQGRVFISQTMGEDGSVSEKSIAERLRASTVCFTFLIRDNPW